MVLQIGQEIKTVINEFRNQCWINKFWSEKGFALKASMHFDLLSYVEDILVAGIRQLDNKYGEFFVFMENQIYIYLFCRQRISLPNGFFEDFELAIDTLLKKFANNWEIIGTKNESVVYEREFDPIFPRFYHIIRLLIEDMKNPNLKMEDCFWGSEIRIHGNQKNLLSLINSIVSKLSPLSCQPLCPQPPSIPSLQTICAKKIATFYYNPGFFSIVESLPDNLQDEIKTNVWTSLDCFEKVAPFAGKIILFTSIRPINLMNNGYQIDSRNPSISVALIYHTMYSESDKQGGYEFHVLLARGHGSLSYVLSTSCLKHSEFNVRLPTLNELEKIETSIHCKEVGFQFSTFLSIDTTINAQKSVLQSYPAIEIEQSLMFSLN